jgi:hypothetical protein
MPSCQILRLETVKGNTNTDVFNPFTDTITLRITFNVSQDLSQGKRRARARGASLHRVASHIG